MRSINVHDQKSINKSVIEALSTDKAKKTVVNLPTTQNCMKNYFGLYQEMMKFNLQN